MALKINCGLCDKDMGSLEPYKILDNKYVCMTCYNKPKEVNTSIGNDDLIKNFYDNLPDEMIPWVGFYDKNNKLVAQGNFLLYDRKPSEAPVDLTYVQYKHKFKFSMNNLQAQKCGSSGLDQFVEDFNDFEKDHIDWCHLKIKGIVYTFQFSKMLNSFIFIDQHLITITVKFLGR